MTSIDRVLYAPNVHQGGGKTLLLPLLDALKSSRNVLFILDERLQFPKGLTLSGKIVRVRPTLLSRLLLEFRLKNMVNGEMELLCFGNLPPLWAHHGRQVLFIQNRYLVDNVFLSEFPLFVRVRIALERWWLRSRQRYVKRFVVQTPTMQRLLSDALGREAEVLPFAPLLSFKRELKDSGDEKQYDFLYVASGEPHKNHRNLILAWVELAKENKYLTLCLTLDRKLFPKLCSWIASVTEKHQMRVTMTGDLSQNNIHHLYHQARALIYPSLLESFGLPLLEAVSAGLPVLATNTDYVRDVVHPTAVFNPYSPQSIAQAVQEFTYKPASLAIDLLNAKEFLSAVFTEDFI